MYICKCILLCILFLLNLQIMYVVTLSIFCAEASY